MATLEPIRTIRYIIALPNSQFLYDLWNGKASYSTAANHALTTGYAWLDMDSAVRKLKEVSAITGAEHILACVELERKGGMWHPIRQQAINQ